MKIIKMSVLLTASALLLVSGIASSPATASTDFNNQSVAIAKTTITFPDASSFKGEINYLADKGIIMGFPDGNFNPSASIKRIDAIRMIMREMNFKNMTAPNPGFSDMTPQTPGYIDFAKAVDIGIISGKVKADGTKYFDPTSTLSRGEMAKILTDGYKLVKNNNVEFRDVNSKHWAKKYISRLATAKITVGYSDGTFKPSDDLSREHFAAFMARLLNPAAFIKPVSPPDDDVMVGEDDPIDDSGEVIVPHPFS